MFDTAAKKLSEAALRMYCATHMHHEAPLFKCSALYSAYKKDVNEGLECWEGKEASYLPGCYFIYSEFDELLYVGKTSVATSTVGRRLWQHLKKTPPSWVPAPAFVQIVGVNQAFQASSLEDYLILTLRPKFNVVGGKTVQKRPWPRWTLWRALRLPPANCCKHFSRAASFFKAPSVGSGPLARVRLRWGLVLEARRTCACCC